MSLPYQDRVFLRQSLSGEQIDIGFAVVHRYHGYIAGNPPQDYDRGRHSFEPLCVFFDTGSLRSPCQNGPLKAFNGSMP